MYNYSNIWQVVWMGMTTNERMNCRRYTHFNKDPEGHVSSPFQSVYLYFCECDITVFPMISSRGLFQNFLDFFDIKITRKIRAQHLDWRQIYDLEHFKDTYDNRKGNFYAV